MTTLDRITAPTSVIPTAVSLDLLLTARTPISHHDPDNHDKSNISLFNRAKHLLFSGPPADMEPHPSIDAFFVNHPVPADMTDLFTNLDIPAFVATAALKLFADIYNNGEGEGIFEGMERWDRLFARSKTAAVRSHSLRTFWDVLTSDLQVGLHDIRFDPAVSALFSLPLRLQSAAVNAIAKHHNSIVSIARLWHHELKPAKDKFLPLVVTLTGADLVHVFEYGDPDIQVPAISANSIRHVVVREPGFLHLMEALGFSEDWPGKGPLSAGVEGIFAMGGNIAPGAKEPSDPFGKGNRARELYPLLDLLSGCADAFMLGESRLKVASWIVCKENREAFASSPIYDHPAAHVSAFDMLDSVTITRMQHRGEGQQIAGFEALVPGVPILARLVLTPHTPHLTVGALGAAVDFFTCNYPVIGGQSARGFGFVDVTPLDADIMQMIDEAHYDYDHYLERHYDELRSGLIDGTLGNAIRILS